MTRPTLCRRAQPRGGCVILTDVGASAQGERDAEAFQPAVRFQHHVRGGIVRVSVLHIRQQEWSVFQNKVQPFRPGLNNNKK